MTQSERSQWRSRVGFIWAAAGSAVGLGNIWRFPYLTGENGGSMFVLLYLLCVLVLGLPIMIGEVMLGKISQRNPVGAFRALAGPRSRWQLTGFMGVLAAFVILSFYSVVAGWCIDFIYKAATGVFQPGHTMEEVSKLFGDLVSSPMQQTFFHGIFMFLTIVVVVAGVQKGLQRCTEILMPALIALLAVLIVYGVTRPGAMEGVRFLLEPKPSDLTWDSVLAAMGQCFFSLSLGMGAMLTYGSYLRRDDHVPGSAAWVVVMDTGIALLAGFAIFPVVFSFGQEPNQGAGLVFKTMPAAFLQMPGGTWMALAFFILLLFAALTSAISLLEVVTSFFVDEYRMPRAMAAGMFGIVCFLMGIGSAYSDKYLDFLDGLQSVYLLPLGGLLISLFAGWRVDRKVIQAEFSGRLTRKLLPVWLVCVRMVAPVLVLLVFLNAIGFFQRLFK